MLLKYEEIARPCVFLCVVHKVSAECSCDSSDYQLCGLIYKSINNNLRDLGIPIISPLRSASWQNVESSRQKRRWKSVWSIVSPRYSQKNWRNFNKGADSFCCRITSEASFSLVWDWRGGRGSVPSRDSHSDTDRYSISLMFLHILEREKFAIIILYKTMYSCTKLNIYAFCHRVYRS